jgi:hypothetical protein
MLFLWAGCCMHKEMNTIKGGNAQMIDFWAKAGFTDPMKLMNQDNSAAVEFGGTAARKRASDVSQAGAVKLTSLHFCSQGQEEGTTGQFTNLSASSYWLYGLFP